MSGKSELETLSRRVAELEQDNQRLRAATGAERSSALHYRAIFESAVDFAIVATNRQGLITDWNAGAARIFGWSSAEMRGAPADRFFTPEDRADGRVAAEMRRALEDGRASDERWHLRKDGLRFWASGEMMPLRDAGRCHLGYIKIVRDSTALHHAVVAARHAEETLREAQGLNTLVMESSRDCIVVLDLDGHTQLVSPGGIEAMEIDDVDALIGRSWLRAWQGGDQAAARDAVASARAGGTGRFVGFCATQRGTPKWWDVAISPLPGADGRPQRLVSIGRDVTARKHAEQRLEISEERLNLALGASGMVGIWDYDAKADILYADANFARLYGVDPALAARGAPLVRYVENLHPDDMPAAHQHIAQWFHSGTPAEGQTREYRIVLPGGGVRWVLPSGRVERDAEGHASRFIGVAVDITERKADEARQALLLRLSDRLLSLAEPHAVLTASVDELGRHLGASRAGCGRVLADGRTIVLEAGYCDDVRPLAGAFAMDAFGAVNIELQRKGKTVVCDDVAAKNGPNAGSAAETADVWAAIDTRAFVLVPLVREGQWCGTLYVNHREPRRWLPAEVALIEDVAARMWYALERARVETALRVSEGRLGSALSIAALGTFEWEAASGALILSERSRQIAGFDVQQALHIDELLARVHPDDRTTLTAGAAAAARSMSRLEMQFRLLLPGGGVRHVKLVGIGMPGGVDAPQRQIGVLEDVTVRVLVERAVRESEQQFRTLAQALPNHVWTSLPDGRLDWFNERVYAFSGKAAGELDGERWIGIVHPGDVAEASQRWAAALASGDAYEMEFRLRRADGAYRWHLARAVAVRGDDGEIARWIGTNTDIEEQRSARAVLSDLNAVLEARVEERTRERDRAWKNSRDLQVVVDPAGNVRAANVAWTTILGWPAAEVAGRNVQDFIHPDDWAGSRAALDIAAVAPLPTFENRFRHASGGWRWISWVAAPEDGLIYASGRHVTDEKEASAKLSLAQEQLRQSQKMEAVGQLTGGVAHDFNNLLQIISGNLQLITRLAAGNEKLVQRVNGAQDAVRRGAKLAGQLLAFSRRQPLEPKVVNVGRLVAGMEDMLRRAIGEAIEIETVASGGLWATFVDPAQIENAVLNLAINARDAMAGAGRLTIEVGNAVLDDAYARGHADVAPGQYVMLAVSDNGCGMPPEVMAQVFEPFFSTKPLGAGTGLGLSMVYGFVKQSGGHVKIYSEVGHGTTMRMYLPRTRQAEDPVAPVDAGQVSGGHESVLVAEDDDGVRATVVDLLGELGYRVLTARDAAGALALLEGGAEVDLLFTDVVMPGPLSSPELAHRARERLPGIAVLFTSGYAQEAIVHGGRLDAGLDLLAKPYTREALARKIRQVLAKRSPASAPVPPP